MWRVCVRGDGVRCSQTLTKVASIHQCKQVPNTQQRNELLVQLPQQPLCKFSRLDILESHFQYD